MGFLSEFPFAYADMTALCLGACVLVQKQLRSDPTYLFTYFFVSNGPNFLINLT
jgi:hypothetical protein